MAVKKILVTGASGQLGFELRSLEADFPGFDFVFADRTMLDIANSHSVNEFISKHSFDVCINAAAYTAVDKAESDEEQAYMVNALAAGFLAQACAANNTKLIHISTDFVFDGNACTPYTEAAAVNPLGVYGASKLKGEEEVLKYNALVIRTSWLYSTHGNNFVKTMLRLSESRSEINVVFDQVGTPTYCADLAAAILHICSNSQYLEQTGVFHFSNEGVASWYDLAVAVFELSHVNCKIYPILSKEYPVPARRPHFSVLNKSKFKNEFGYTIRHWREALKDCISKLQA
jgi:dTDP-4-dehydrorhamnose reductase